MSLVAIDPGPQKSALVSLVGDPNGKHYWQPVGILPNEEILEKLPEEGYRELAIEMIASYGMPVGAEVFETCVWIGRFIEAWRSFVVPGSSYTLIYRHEVKMELCHSTRAKDANIRQALLDRIGPQGTKKAPGPTYGFKQDLWAALAVGVTYLALRDSTSGT